MGVFGEKHTSLTREQKRQLIYQADTQKLRPTEVCAWVMATWGLRIARVTVYSILHKQRASLMEGYTQEAIAAAAATVASLQPNSTSKAASKPKARASKASKKNRDDHVTTQSATSNKRGSMLAHGEQQKQNHHTRIHENKYRTSSVSSGENSSQKRRRSASVASDRSMSSSVSIANNEGPRSEGQLKRVREPASAELDRAMVEFLKSPASVDAQGRRLNDAELQAHALRLAQSIPSAQRMRCSFGWLRHFKRRLGVHWREDSSSMSASSTEDGQGSSGQYRWVIENERKEQQDKEGIESGSDSSSSGSEDDDGDSEEYFSSRETLNISSPLKKRCRTTSASSSPPLHSPQSILATFSTTSTTQDSTVFNDALPLLHVPSSTSTPPSFAPVSSSSTIDPKKLLEGPHFTGFTPSSAFGMSVDGKMRKVPSKEEAYDMLQSLLLYYEQDHCSHAHYVGEQQTLLLPRWIHQQRQIISMTGPTSLQQGSGMETSKTMAWINQSHQNQYPFPSLLMNHHHHNQQQAYFPYHQSPFPGPNISTAPVSLFPSLPTPPLSYHSGSSVASSTSRSLSSSCSPPALSPLSELGALSPISPMLSPLSPLIGGHKADGQDSLQLTTLALEKQMAARRESLSAPSTLPLSIAGLGALTMW